MTSCEVIENKFQQQENPLEAQMYIPMQNDSFPCVPERVDG